MAVVVGVLALGGEPDPLDGAQEAADALAAGMRSGDLSAVAFSDGVNGADYDDDVRQATAGLGSADPMLPTSVTAEPILPDETKRRASTELAYTWTLDDGVEWSYSAMATLLRDGEDWVVVWSPGLIHPELGPGEGLDAEETPAARGTLVGASGTPLFSDQEVVIVGIEPRATGGDAEAGATDEQKTAVSDQVAAALEVNPDELRQRVLSAPPDQLVEVARLRRSDYEEVKPEIYDLPGTRFRTTTMNLAPDARFAWGVVGSVGEATAEEIEESGGRLQAGDLVGKGGLQEAYDERLRGTPGVRVSVVALDDGTTDADADASAPGAAEDAPPAAREIFAEAPVDGQDVAITLDAAIQSAADAAVEGSPQPTSLVAIRPSTGEVVAAANGGAGASGFDQALLGQYPPGSTFKVVSTTALLGAGLSPDEVVDCPPSLDVGGKVFVNAEDHASGAVPFRVDFAESCNTAFVSLADRITQEQLAAAAGSLGLAEGYDIGLANLGGEVPAAADVVEHAASMIGQGRVLSSPLGMAVVAASVANGATVQPSLVLDPAPDAPANELPALDAGVAGTVGGLMREVVTSGTATVLAGIPGEPVQAKTGTAEFGSEVPPRTHGWMIGSQGDLAFAVVVEDGGFGSDSAGPVAAAFLTALNGG